jgi:hypothetical protein
MRIEMGKVKAWSAETPNMYTMLVTMSAPALEGDQDATAEVVVDVIRLRVGMRKVQVSEGRLRVNGRVVKLRGVNRHEHTPDLGHVVSIESMLHDIRLMKEFNFNCVRCSHYPADERFYALCDEVGLYVIDEANIESHGMGYAPDKTLAAKPEWEAAHLDRIQRTFERDKNFTCIIIWSLGNEAGNGPAMLRGYAWLKRRDPWRPVQYENARVEELWSSDAIETIDANTDIYAPMYPTPAKLRAYAHAYSLDPDARPLIMCEYSHAMGNSCGGLMDYWDAINEHEVLQGGCIWDWVDQGLVLPVSSPKARAAAEQAALAGDCEGLPMTRRGMMSKWRRPVFGYGGDYGPPDTPSDEAFCINGLFQPDRTPNPHAWEAMTAMQPIAVELAPRAAIYDRAEDILDSKLSLRIWNRFDFVSLEGIECTWEVILDGILVTKGTLDLPACEAGKSVEVGLKVPGKQVQPVGAGFANMTSIWSRETPQLTSTNILSAFDKFLMQGGKEVADALKKNKLVSFSTGTLTLPTGVRRAGDVVREGRGQGEEGAGAAGPDARVHGKESVGPVEGVGVPSRAEEKSHPSIPGARLAGTGEIDLKAKIAALRERDKASKGAGCGKASMKLGGSEPSEESASAAAVEKDATPPATCEKHAASPSPHYTRPELPAQVAVAEPGVVKAEAVLSLRFHRKQKSQALAHAQFILPALESASQPALQTEGGGETGEGPVVDQGWEGGAAVRGEHNGRSFAVYFSRQTGLPVQMEYDGEKQLCEENGGFRLNLWRPVTDNDLGAHQLEKLQVSRARLRCHMRSDGFALVSAHTHACLLSRTPVSSFVCCSVTEDAFPAAVILQRRAPSGGHAPAGSDQGGAPEHRSGVSDCDL